MKLHKMIMVGALALGLSGLTVFTNSATVNADDTSSNIAIDGQYSDWQSTKLTTGYNGGIAIVGDGQYADIYVHMQYGDVPSSGYVLSINGKDYYMSSKSSDGSSGDSKQVSFTGGKWDGGDQYGTVGTGYVSQDNGSGVGEFRIDLSKFDDSSSSASQKVSVRAYSIGNTPATTSTNITSPTTSTGVVTDKGDTNEKGDTPTDVNASNDNDNLNTNIDGKYQDWKNMTLTEGYNGYTAMSSDGDNIYVYVKMKNGTVPGYGDYNFDIGGKKFYIWSDNISNNLSSGESKKISLTGGDINEGHQYGTVGTGYVSNVDNKSVAEFKIDMSKLGVSSMTGQTITMSNPNIGAQKVTVAGGSTGPILLSGIGAVVAILGYVQLKRKGYLDKKDLRISGK
ncbi:Firmicu-CTERM sorting domain-containing protein [Companilactobacillus allii]|uniref:Firmicu-CTERM sorting domain-containing protein n=1 Tax=Companilactobacillus allii TaxID=1847728 RepID=A0A1P8Q059_9LACO|nr:Firmicu-CTERM sorting domain-containing protein [Companilactobacillus allii]APX71262.1 Firmicu-CTERM sorting domain-containing protein [Companilactobacillus allii]USQ68344.1 Firmicu-CTERM sorting domain-containing protein [Companilactobacillus allii]